ncbi:MAG: septal ring lytic transglycosylase RlpA family protein [Nitrospirota bacterium]
MASWYGPDFHGRPTSSGELFNMYALTCAHREHPFGTRLKVTNISNNKTVSCVINDRGPFVSGRDLDLSYAAITG